MLCRRTGDVNIRIVQTLLEHGADPNICPHCTDSPLSAAASSRNNQLVMLLIKSGAKIDHIDKLGKTALHFAIGSDDMQFTRHLELTERCESDTSIAKALLSAGADANVLDSSGGSPLYMACVKGNTNFVTLLLRHGASPNTGTADKYPIHAACRGHRFDLVKQLLEYNADVSGRHCRTLPLHIAVTDNNSELVELLLKHASVDVTDTDGNTALHHAVEYVLRWGYSDRGVASSNAKSVIDILLENKADVNAVNNVGKTPLYKAASKEWLLDIVSKMLQEYGGSLSKGSPDGTPLVIACRQQNVEVVDVMLKHGADPNLATKCWHHLKHKLPLHIAVSIDNSELVELLLKHGANVDVTDAHGNTALHHAASHSYPSHEVVASSHAKSVVDILLENKADVNFLNRTGETPLYRAVHNEMLDVVSETMPSFGGNSHIGSPDKGLPSAAQVIQNVKVVEVLLKHGANPNLPSTSCYHDSKHKFPLFVAVDKGKSEVVELLLKHGANINFTDSDGNTALHHVIEQQPIVTPSQYSDHVVAANSVKSVLDILLENKADVNAVNNAGETPLYKAASRGLLDIVSKMLQEYGGSLSKGPADGTPLVIACRQQNVEVVDVILKHGADPNLATKYWIRPNRYSERKMPLHIAVSTDNSELVELLLKHGANIDITDDGGNTALHHATDHYYQSSRYSRKVVALSHAKSVIDILLENKADVNFLNRTGETPLYRAVQNGMLDVVSKMLEMYGRNPNKVSSDKTPSCHLDLRNKLPLFAAVNNNSSELVEMLLKHGANIDVTDSDGNTALHLAINRCRLSRYLHTPVVSNNAKSVPDILLENKADVNIVNNYGQTPLCEAASNGLLDIVSKMLEHYGGNPNKASLNESPLACACTVQNAELVDMLLKHGADPNPASTARHTIPLFIAADEDNSGIVTSLLNAGASVNALNDEGKSVACSVSEMLTGGRGIHNYTKKLSTIRLLLQHGAHFNTLMPDGKTPLCLIVDALKRTRRSDEYRTRVVESLQLMVKHGAMLLESSSQLEDEISCQSLNSEALGALAIFDCKHVL